MFHWCILNIHLKYFMLSSFHRGLEIHISLNIKTFSFLLKVKLSPVYILPTITCLGTQYFWYLIIFSLFLHIVNKKCSNIPDRFHSTTLIQKMFMYYSYSNNLWKRGYPFWPCICNLDSDASVLEKIHKCILEIVRINWTQGTLAQLDKKSQRRNY